MSAGKEKKPDRRTFPHNKREFFVDVNDPTGIRYRLSCDRERMTPGHKWLVDRIGEVINEYFATLGKDAPDDSSVVLPSPPASRTPGRVG